MAEGIRVALYGSGQAPDGTWYGPKGTATEHEDGKGYVIKWDDGFEDFAITRWHFENDPDAADYNMVRLNEGE